MPQNINLQNPLVSVLMPAYNAEAFIRQAIDSILNQTYTNLELLIADDASKDNTKKIIESYEDKRIKVFHNEVNLGYLKTWNKLMAFSQGDYITFQDADDYSDYNRIELLIKEFEKDPELGLCGSNYIRIDESNHLKEYSDFSLSHEEIYNFIPIKYDFIGSALMINKKVYEEIGEYHVFFDRMGQEDHYWVFLAISSFKIKNIPDHLYYYRFNPDSVSGNISNNPSKLNSQQIVEYLILQRKETGTDLLSQGRDKELMEILNELNKPFVRNPSYYYYYIAKRRFYEGRREIAIKNMLKALKISPLKIQYYKDLLYFIRTNI